MMNAGALETGPGFRNESGTFRRHKACYSFIIHRLSGPKPLCMSGLLKTTTPNVTAGNRTLASRVRVQLSTDCAISAAQKKEVQKLEVHLIYPIRYRS